MFPFSEILIKDVSLTYPNKIVPAIANVSLTIPAGTSIAIVGPSGAGKSTLFQLAERFYDPEIGTVRIDGVALTSADPAEFRRRISLVPQDTVLFAASARDNLRYGQWDASDIEKIDAQDRMNELREQIRILEIGCSSGAFLSELKESLSSVGMLDKCILAGIDIDETAVRKNVDSSIEIYAVGAEEYAKSSEEKYDLIIHFELIEHLQNPFSFMQSVAKLLTPNGLHHFHTPNGNGFDNQALGYNEFRALAHGIFPPMHLQAFTPQNIVHFSIRSGFKVVQIDTPGNFDVDIVKSFLEPKNSESPYRFIESVFLKSRYGLKHIIKD
jgi:2-polyprenyl-3-methyl-5-hydroxy-6-metoxy-1,4-benzoquinol methylase